MYSDSGSKYEFKYLSPTCSSLLIQFTLNLRAGRKWLKNCSFDVCGGIQREREDAYFTQMNVAYMHASIFLGVIET